MKLKQMLIILGIVLVVFAPFLLRTLRVHQLENSFSKVKENDARDLVLRRMGAPWKDEDCGVYLGGSPPGCVEEFIYADPFAPYFPGYWVVSFNSSHKVIQLVHPLSP
ncbi:MAG TPA: hypothetical protein VJX73_08220 [Terracidiphilus sp.]|nr:hypothetical protein [Terracidiphilus sp.]